MNRNTIIANVKHADLVTEWADIVKEYWEKPLPPLDAAYLFCYPEHETPSMVGLIYRKTNDNTHRNTHWFLCDIVERELIHHDRQDRMFADVKPAQGVCFTLWYRTFWQEMARSPYNLAMKHDLATGLYLNTAET